MIWLGSLLHVKVISNYSQKQSMEYNLMWNRNFRGMDANDQQQDSYMYMDSTLLRENLVKMVRSEMLNYNC